MIRKPQWLKYLPESLRVKIEHRPNLLRVLENATWLIGDKIFRMGMSLIVGVWVARYLGPEKFGLFNYATAFVGLFSSIAGLGLNGIVVRDLVRHPESAHSTLGTAFVMQIIGGILAFSLAVIAISYVRPTDTFSITAVTIVALALMFKACDVVKYWFESKIQSKYTVWVENGSSLAFALVKIGMILYQAPLIAFIWIFSLEAIFVALGLLGFYTLAKGGIRKWQYNTNRATKLFSDSWPLILSGITVMIYMRLDQIMLGQMIGNEAVGIFSAATRVSEIWYFVPSAIVSSVIPSIIEAHKTNIKLYYSRLKKLLEIVFLLAVALAIIVTLASNRLMHLLYGPGYAESATVLVIHIWAGVFVFLGVASSQWFLIENLQRYSFYRTLAGAIVNVFLNLALIPKYGAVGSAWATVISQAVASVFFNSFNAKTRILFTMQIKVIAGVSFFQK